MKIIITLNTPLKVTDNKIMEAYIRHGLKMFDIRKVVVEWEKVE